VPGMLCVALFVAVVLAASPAASESAKEERSTGEADTGMDHVPGERVFDRDTAVFEDKPGPQRRKLGPASGRLVIPEPWVIVPERFRVGSHELELHLLGYIKLDGLHDFEANGLGVGFPNEFLPAQIPPKGSLAARNRGRWGFTANSSRLEIGVGTTTPLGKAGGLLDFDFIRTLSGRPAFQLRQLYATLGPLRVGQSWTTFLNVESIPSTLDYQGPNAIPEVWQPLVRWTQPLAVGPLREYSLAKEFEFVVAAEEADPQLTLPVGVSSRDDVPDIVANLRWRRERSSVWVAGIYRRFEARGAGVDASANGWGLQLTGNIEVDPFPYLQFGVLYGKGLGRYFNDTGGLDVDGWVSPSGDLDLFSGFGAWIGIQYWWTAPLRSTFTYSYVHLGDSDLRALSAANPNGIYRKAHYASANLVYSPIPPLDIGVEYLFGWRGTVDGRSGYDQRIQLSLILHFASGEVARGKRSLTDRLLGREPEAN